MNVENKISLKGLSVWSICAIFFMYEFLLRTVVGTFQTQLMSDLNLTPMTFSLLSSTGYLVIYGVMQIPVGIITDRFGLKKTLFIALIFCASSTMCFALSHHFSIAMVCRIFMGLGSSFGFICLLIAVYDWMPRKNIALFIGVSQFIGTLGPMLAAGPLNSLAQNSMIGWRGIFFSMAIIGIIIAALTLLFVENNRNNREKFIVLTKPVKISLNLQKLMSHKQVWSIALFSGCVYFAIEYFSENIGVEFLIKKGFSPTFSSYMITLAWLGYALGCPLLGFISDKIYRRKPVMLASALASLISLSGIIYFSLGEMLTGLCFLALGLSASGQSIGFVAIAEQCKENYLAIGLAFNNTMIAIITSVNAPIIGGMLPYPAQVKNYQEALFVLIIFSIVSVIISAFMIKETFGKSVRENTILSFDSTNASCNLI
ncbi:TPA: MFS transporter [Legionella pneumophila]|uniref:Lysosomal dipeptide transporter MFSD1 n=1 Tax=Legionella pneumophila TaxID=446 RepID=A0AAN5KU07_LEGPN|nr:MFS transporter [Legionella pneumophila]HAT1597908.1 MFS transporter [Legionella pneumophila]HAT1971712.1 MFS transporter [Legionella pneumophila]HAT1973617.1 MFS transporter [Legionella pneumophila]HAT6955674.1 MFS transporter [Legionella pneumophila]